MLVSTMDGYLTAMDAATGVEEWSVSTGLSLVSSSISKFEVSCLFIIYHKTSCRSQFLRMHRVSDTGYGS